MNEAVVYFVRSLPTCLHLHGIACYRCPPNPHTLHDSIYLDHDYSVTLTIRKIEKEILAAGGHVMILTTPSGPPKNTNLVPSHPRRLVVFLDNSVPLTFFMCNPDDPETHYHLGFSLSRAVKDQLDEFRPDVVHLTVPDMTGLHVVNYARDRMIPLMGTFHSNIVDYMDHYPGLGWLKPILAAFFRHQYNFLQALYVPTPYTRRHLIETDRIDRITDLKVWGRGVDIDRFSPKHRSVKFRHNIGIRDDEVVILFVGRLVPEKRPDVFAKVVRRLASEPDLKFRAVIVGSGPSLDEMRSLPQTICLGWLGGEDLAVAYASSDIFMFPSSVETFGNVTLEAAASGLPLLVDEGCSGHLVDDCKNGYALAAGDVEAYHRAARELVVDANRRADMAASSRPLALRLEQSGVTQEMLDHYEQASEQFYGEYAGQHSIRDQAYLNPDSFLAGTDPRPFGMGTLELFFVKAFVAISFLLSWYQMMHRMFLTPAMLRIRMVATATASSVALSKKDEDASTCSRSVVIERDGALSQDEKSPLFVPTFRSTTCLTATEAVSASSSTASSSETESESSSGGGFDLDARASSSGHPSTNSPRRTACATFGDSKVALALSTAFVQTVCLSSRTTTKLSLSVSSLWQRATPQLASEGRHIPERSTIRKSLVPIA